MVRLNSIAHTRHLWLLLLTHGLLIDHLLLLEKEILLLLLKHPLLKHLLKLDLNLLWEMSLLDWEPVLVVILLSTHLALVLGVLQQLDNLLG